MNEFELIAELTRDAPETARDLLKGVGDDCAVINAGDGRDWLVSTDALLENVHFRREWCDLKTLGRKMLAVNLSDIAAMGGAPRFYTVALGLPGDMISGPAGELYDGMRQRASDVDVIMIGGDTVLSPNGIYVSITVIGETPHGRSILRSGAAAGDAVYVTGLPGQAATGLFCVEKNFSGERFRRYTERFLDPSPRIAEGRWLKNSGMVTSMIDVSDGMLADLSHIADESGVGFVIESGEIPMDSGFGKIASELKRDPMELACIGGEDYELLFTVKGDEIEKFSRSVEGAGLGVSVTRIGTIVADTARRVVVDNEGREVKFARRGFDHFLK